jgi:hypothetical protein
MKQERVILSFIMVLIGLLVAGAAFYFYQSTKTLPEKSSVATDVTKATPTPAPTIFLTINQPANESVVSNKTLIISGKTSPNATVLLITDSGQEAFTPSSQGDFSTTITLDNGQNIITIEAVLGNGEIASTQRVVTYSTESF